MSEFGKNLAEREENIVTAAIEITSHAIGKSGASDIIEKWRKGSSSWQAFCEHDRKASKELKDSMKAEWEGKLPNASIELIDAGSHYSKEWVYLTLHIAGLVELVVEELVLLPLLTIIDDLKDYLIKILRGL